MCERDQLPGPLRRPDPRQPGGPEHVALGRVAARHRRRRLGRHSHPRLGARPARRLGLGGDVDHPRAARLVEVGEPAGHADGRSGALDPALIATALDLALPDRRLGLDPVDRLARAGERLAAVGGRDRDDDARLTERHRADAVLGGGRLEPVARLHLLEDRGDPLGRHLAVGLVLEPLDLARGAAEDDDRAGAGPPDRRRQVGDRQRILGNPGAGCGGRTAAHRRDQRQLVALGDRCVVGDVLAVERGADRHRGQHLAEARLAGGGLEHVGDGRALVELERERVASRALAKDCEQSNFDLHRADRRSR